MKTTVLLVEPSVIFQRLYVALFSTIGCHPTCVTALAEALEVLQTTMPSLIVIDMHKSEGSALDAARRLRAAAGAADVPIIVLGTSPADAERESGTLGRTSFVTRPIQIDQFAGLARRCIGAAA